MNSAEDYTYRYLETDDLDQYNALLRYTFQVTEEELTATGWKDDDIKQSKFPVLERADVLGCFDGKNLVSQFAVYPLKMNIYDTVYHVGFVTSVCTCVWRNIKRGSNRCFDCYIHNFAQVR